MPLRIYLICSADKSPVLVKGSWKCVLSQCPLSVKRACLCCSFNKQSAYFTLRKVKDTTVHKLDRKETRLTSNFRKFVGLICVPSNPEAMASYNSAVEGLVTQCIMLYSMTWKHNYANIVLSANTQYPKGIAFRLHNVFWKQWSQTNTRRGGIIDVFAAQIFTVANKCNC